MSITEYIKQLQSFEEYSFSWIEILSRCNAPEPTLRKELTRLVQRKEIVKLRKGFYLIIPPRYQNVGKIPLQLYVDKLFIFLERDYYVGLFTAAAVHGASHQRIQQDYIITIPPTLTDVDKGKNKLRFLKTENLPEKNIIEKKSDAGLYKISSPALTAVDLVHYHPKIGGMNRMLANLEELSQEIGIEDLDQLLSWYPHKSTLQRFGYLMEQLNASESITSKIFKSLQKEPFYSVLLTPKKGVKAGKTGNRWKVDVNIKLESDI
jgi:predicted transcriptional regulator of viral defense system